MRILVGYQDTELAQHDRKRWDVQFVKHGRDGHSPPISIAEMLSQCPPGWTPDVYYHSSLVHFPLPTDIAEFNGLTATNIQDWHRGGRAVWAGVGFFDMVVAERTACRMLQANGYQNARFARFWGADPHLHRLLPDVERDIDVLFIGALNAAVWEERNRWLDRLARLADRVRVVIALGHWGEDYVRLTNRAKIVFNRSVNGCTNQRAYDAPACGALVFNEAENEETRAIFTDGVHCVYYTEEDLETRLVYYLNHPQERERIVEQGRQLVLAEHTESHHADAIFALLESSLDAPPYRPYTHLPPEERLIRKAFQIFNSAQPASAPVALALLEAAESASHPSARLMEARAALHGWLAHYQQGEAKIKNFTTALKWARQAVQAAPGNAIAQMTLAFLLLERAEATQGKHPTGRNDVAEAAVALAAAAEYCETTADRRDPAVPDVSSALVEGFGYPRWSDLFDCRLDRAYLLREANPTEWTRVMRATVAWRCRFLLGDLAGANEQREEAYRQAEAAYHDAPNEAQTLLRLAHDEALTGRLEAAVVHYQEGLARTPFAYDYWPEYASVLVALGRRDEAEAFVQERFTVLQAVPSFAAIRPALRAAIA